MIDSWPTTLPLPEQNNFEYEADLGILHDGPEPADVLRRDSIMNTALSLTFLMRQAQVHEFVNFYNTHLNKWFRMHLPNPFHPMHARACTIRFTSGYQMAKRGFEDYEVSVSAESGRTF